MILVLINGKLNMSQQRALTAQRANRTWGASDTALPAG